jgi:hypothetical protein
VSGPPWLAAALTAGFVVIALYCAACLLTQGLADRRAAAAEANHVVMATAMAAMALPAGMAWVRPEVGAAAFALTGVAWAVIGLRSRRVPSPAVGGVACPSPPAHLALLDVAMAGMYGVMLVRAPVPAGTAEMSGMNGMADMGGHAHVMAPAPSPTLLLAGGVLVLVLIVHAGRRVAVAATVGGAPLAGAGPLPRVTGSARARESCQAVMSAGMAVMLVVMLAG